MIIAKLLGFPSSKSPMPWFPFPHSPFPASAGTNNRSRPMKLATRPRSSVEVTFHLRPCSLAAGQAGREDPAWWSDPSHDTAGERRIQTCQGGTCKWHNSIVVVAHGERGRERERGGGEREREREGRIWICQEKEHACASHHIKLYNTYNYCDVCFLGLIARCKSPVNTTN